MTRSRHRGSLAVVLAAAGVLARCSACPDKVSGVGDACVDEAGCGEGLVCLGGECHAPAGDAGPDAGDAFDAGSVDDNIYVDVSGGDDANPATAARPLKTLAAALRRAPAGAHVLVS